MQQNMTIENKILYSPNEIVSFEAATKIKLEIRYFISLCYLSIQTDLYIYF